MILNLFYMGRRWLTRKGSYILKSNLPIGVQNMTKIYRIFSGRKNYEHKSSGRDLNGPPETEILGSLKNLKPEKIGLWAKCNRRIRI